MVQMCNLGEGIAKRAYAEGEEQGESNILISLIKDKSITVETALTKTSLTKEEFMEKLYKAGYEE